MSHDLYFINPTISQEQFTEYFRSRSNYIVSGSQAMYKNEDTGVYFTVDHNSLDDGEEDESGEELRSTASSCVNYCRPHIFGLEAAEEIASLVEYFGFSIFDPQNSGMGDGPFSVQGFLRSWNAGNELGYSAILQQRGKSQQDFTLPSTRLETIWRWNRAKAQVQSSIGTNLFVPRVFFLWVKGQVVSAAVWPDAISELIPEVDFLIIGQTLVPFAHLLPDLATFKTNKYPLPAYRLPEPEIPNYLQKRVQTLKPTGITGQAIPVDQILTRELVRKITGF